MTDKALSDAFRRARLSSSPAVLALQIARNRLADLAAAESNLAAARLQSEEAAALAAPFKAARFGPYTLTPPDAAPAIKAADSAFQKEEAARRRVSAALRCVSPVSPSYGPGTWQGEAAAVLADSPFGGVPPGLRTGASYVNRISRHMRKGEGALFFWHGYTGPGPFRHVKDAPDIIGRNAGRYFDNPDGESFRDGSGLVVGVVAQLRGRDGRAVFVPGFRFCGNDDAGTFDLSDVYTADGREPSDAEEAEKEAARAADTLAERAAERESRYQSAWRAGAAWADLKARVADLRQKALAVLAERRAARAAGGDTFKTLCDVIADHVESLRDDMREAREEMERLRDGDESPYEHDGGEAARAAFCEAAGLDAFPNDSAIWRAVRALRASRVEAAA